MLTAGALALAVIAPALESVEHAAEAVPPPQALPTTPEPAGTALRTGPSQRAGLHHDLADAKRAVAPESARLRVRVATSERASRSGVRRTASVRPVRNRTVVAATTKQYQRNTSHALKKVRSAQRKLARDMRTIAGAGKRVVKQAKQRVFQQRRIVPNRSTVRRTAVRHSRDMRAVIAFARSQVGARYVPGGEGRGGFDCSGFTKRAYARIGLHLPHSSGAQAARARPINRALARPGDLVVGRGHVGIYMGRGMMIDAGNQRTGVVYRKLYRGLQVARL